MNDFLSLPDWAPVWLGPVLMIFGGLFALAFLLMPFTVFSLKSRLEQIELRLEELHADLGAIAAAAQSSQPRSAYAWPEPEPTADRYPVRPPITPPPQPAYAPPPVAPPIAPPIAAPRRDPYAAEPRPSRAEPKLNWPR